MDTKHLIFEVTDFLELQKILDLNAKGGYKAVSFSSYFDGNSGITYYTALMVKEGVTGDL